ncbi:MAG: hypothetical protein AAF250_01480 [Pseudomonadota bacterium]
MSSDYVTVFEASAAPWRDLWFVLPGLAFSVVGAVMVFRPSLVERIPGFRISDRPFSRWFSVIFRWFFFLFAIFWTVTATVVIAARASGALSALEDGDCEIVEGKVQNFNPMPKEGHSKESFVVDGTRFQYSDYVLSAGFNNTASHGGPIREGLQVRICHKHGDILRLEIDQQ